MRSIIQKVWQDWLEDGNKQWLINIFITTTLGIVAIIVQFLVQGEDHSEYSNPPIQISGNENTAIQIRNSPGSTIDIVRDINSDEIAKQISKYLNDNN